MRTNGFIFIALGCTAVALAGPPGYLPSVGPIPMRFALPVVPVSIVPLPPPRPPVVPAGPQADSAASATSATSPEIPTPTPPAPVPETHALMQNPPVVVVQLPATAATNGPTALIGPAPDANNLITPQMFLRFFTPAQGGASREAVVVPPAGFNPAQPPASSSTATFSQPK